MPHLAIVAWFAILAAHLYASALHTLRAAGSTTFQRIARPALTAQFSNTLSEAASRRAGAFGLPDQSSNTFPADQGHVGNLKADCKFSLDRKAQHLCIGDTIVLHRPQSNRYTLSRTTHE
jgi:hypothetical protein